MRPTCPKFSCKQISLPTPSTTLKKSHHSTGAAGFLGGDILHTPVTTHPTWPITFLVRNTPSPHRCHHLSTPHHYPRRARQHHPHRRSSQPSRYRHPRAASDEHVPSAEAIFVSCEGVRGPGRGITYIHRER